MKKLLSLGFVVALGLSAIGCADESKVEKTTTVETPSGTTTTTETDKVETTGENPPPAEPTP